MPRTVGTPVGKQLAIIITFKLIMFESGLCKLIAEGHLGLHLEIEIHLIALKWMNFTFFHLFVV